MMAQRSSVVPSLEHMVCVPTRIAQGLGAGGLIRGDERVQIVGVLEMQVAGQPALGERLARRQRVDGQQPAERAVFGGRISGAEHEGGGVFETVLDDMVDGVFVGVEAGVVLGEPFDGEREALSVEPDSAAGLEARAAIRCRYGSKSNARNPMAATQPGERDRNSSAS